MSKSMRGAARRALDRANIVVYNPNMKVRGGGERVTAALAQRLADYGEVVLIGNERVDLDSLGRYFAVNLSAVEQLAVSDHVRGLRILNRLPIPRSIQVLVADSAISRLIGQSQPQVFVNNSYRSTLPNLGRLGIYMCMFPHRLSFTPGTKVAAMAGNALAAVIVGRSGRLSPTASFADLHYDVVTANSKFTQRHIMAYWGQASEVMYPPCTNMAEPGVLRERIILHVGRFDAPTRSAHYKAQDTLIEAFRGMEFLHEQGWTLRLAGSSGRSAASRRYLADLRAAAHGLPIEFDVDVKYDALRRLYNRASIYWHGTGYGDASESAPERHEHFGITTVEALSAGCVVAAFASAGQRECIRDGEDGYLWSTFDELTRIMHSVTAMSKQDLDDLRARARQSAKRFDESAFGTAVDRLMNEVGLRPAHQTSKAKGPKR